MINLKKYDNYIKKNILNEDIDSSIINDIVSEIENLKSVIKDKIKDSPLNYYYKKYTKDGEEIQKDNIYYIYVKYVDNEYKGKNDQIFSIKIIEELENGYRYDIIKSEIDSSLKGNDINRKSIQFPIKEQLKNIEHINGRFMVADISNINLLGMDVKVDKVDKVDKVEDKKVKSLPYKKSTLYNEIQKLRLMVKELDSSNIKQLIINLESRLNNLKNELDLLIKNNIDKSEIIKSQNNINLLESFINDLKNKL